METPARFGMPWTEDDLRSIHHNVAQGSSITEIAVMLSRSEGEVMGKLRSLAANLFSDGFMTKDAIAMATGLTPEQVESAIREHTILQTRGDVRVMRTAAALDAPVSARSGSGSSGGARSGSSSGGARSGSSGGSSRNIEKPQQPRKNERALKELVTDLSDLLRQIADKLDTFRESCEE